MHCFMKGLSLHMFKEFFIIELRTYHLDIKNGGISMKECTNCHSHNEDQAEKCADCESELINETINQETKNNEEFGQTIQNPTRVYDEPRGYQRKSGCD